MSKRSRRERRRERKAARRKFIAAKSRKLQRTMFAGKAHAGLLAAAHLVKTMPRLGPYRRKPGSRRDRRYRNGLLARSQPRHTLRIEGGA